MSTNKPQDFICYMGFVKGNKDTQLSTSALCLFATQQGNSSKKKVLCDFPSQGFSFS